ncbi:hypothetical protein BOX15_Mlig005716g1, partial [Macrostomum lignano]
PSGKRGQLRLSKPAAMPSEKSHPPIKIVGVIVTYWTVSISMVFANKYLVGDKLSDKLDVSLFVAWAQCVSTVLVVVALVAFRRLVLGHDIELRHCLGRFCLNRDFLLLCPACSLACLPLIISA